MEETTRTAIMGILSLEQEQDAVRAEKLNYLTNKPWFMDLMGISAGTVRDPRLDFNSIRHGLPLYDQPGNEYSSSYNVQVTRNPDNHLEIEDLLALSTAQINVFNGAFARNLLKGNLAKLSEIMNYQKMRDELDFLRIADAWRYFNRENLADDPAKRTAIIDFIKEKISSVNLKASIFTYTGSGWGDKALTLEDLKTMPDEQIEYLQTLHDHSYFDTIKGLIVASGISLKDFTAHLYDDNSLEKFVRLAGLISKNSLRFEEAASIPDTHMNRFASLSRYLETKLMSFSDLMDLQGIKSMAAARLLGNNDVYSAVMQKPELAGRIKIASQDDVLRNKVTAFLSTGGSASAESKAYGEMPPDERVTQLVKILNWFMPEKARPPAIRNPEPWA